MAYRRMAGSNNFAELTIDDVMTVSHGVAEVKLRLMAVLSTR